MTLCRMIAPDWLMQEQTSLSRVLEGEFSDAQISTYNQQGYNIYYLPNHPKEYDSSTTVDGTLIDTFDWVFVDCDLKDQVYDSKESFLTALELIDIQPTKVIDSGNGIHAYWKVTNLDAMSYLRFQRRLLRLLSTDEAVGQLFQLMRLPNTFNTKKKGTKLLCKEIKVGMSNISYTCEQLDKLLPPITKADEEYCQNHYNKTYQINQDQTDIDEKLPLSFAKLLASNPEAKDLWSAHADDRSKNDYRLGHLMFANDFTRDEALSVLINSAKALQRAPVHRRNYALNIVDKIWTFEMTKDKESLSESVAQILSRNEDEDLKGQRFACQKFFDGTKHGFRLSQVVGLCAGVGVGKTAIALNIFKGFVENNPDYIHMFVSLEQPSREIAARWKKMTGENTNLHSKVHILSNYNEDGSYRNLSLSEIKDYIIQFQVESKQKVGCICLDHIGVLKQQDKSGEYQGLRDICSQLKSFAIATNTLFIIQSQTNREKAGIGDLELFKDAAYGTQFFESFLDYLLVAWQPLKRCYDQDQCPRVTAYKFAKVRFKSKEDTIIEDQCYRLLFDQDTESLRPMTQDENISFDYFASQALNLRKKDRKTDLIEYKSLETVNEENRSRTSLRSPNSNPKSSQSSEKH